MLAGIVIGKLLDPAEVSFGGALAKPFELDKAGVILIPIMGSEMVILPIFFFFIGLTKVTDSLQPCNSVS